MADLPLPKRVQNVIASSLDLDVLATGNEEAAKRMADLAKSRRTRAQALRDYALQAMQATGIAEVSTDEWGAKLAKKPPAVNITDPLLIPPAFMRTPEPPPPQPDKTAIAAALKSGASVPGCALVQGWRLAVK
jgi:hypothetical protein